MNATACAAFNLQVLSFARYCDTANNNTNTLYGVAAHQLIDWQTHEGGAAVKTRIQTREGLGLIPCRHKIPQMRVNICA